MFMMLARQPVIGEGLFDGLLDPIGELFVSARPLSEPSGKVGFRFGEISAVIEPAQFLKASLGHGGLLPGRG
jgi:hypothetical protein